MGATYSVPTPPEPWGVFESPHSRAPLYRTSLAPVPWIFRGDPNKPFFVLVAMVGAWAGIVIGIWLANNGF